jgi:hypothetical protein
LLFQETIHDQGEVVNASGTFCAGPGVMQIDYAFRGSGSQSVSNEGLRLEVENYAFYDRLHEGTSVAVEASAVTVSNAHVMILGGIGSGTMEMTTYAISFQTLIGTDVGASLNGIDIFNGWPSANDPADFLYGSISIPFTFGVPFTLTLEGFSRANLPFFFGQADMLANVQTSGFFDLAGHPLPDARLALVPEPSFAWVIALGFIGFLWFRKSLTAIRGLLPKPGVG